MTPTRPDADPSHQQIQALMPWVLNGRADAAQREQVQTHLAHCDLCRSEMHHQQQLQSALQLPALREPEVEAGLGRLLQRIELDDVTDQPLPPPAPRGHRLSLALAACVALQAVALVALAPRVWLQDADSYQTLSQPPAASAATSAVVRVVPSPELSLAQWQQLLQAEGLQVSGGPNRVGAYALSPLTPTQDVPALVQRLRAHPELRLVEPLQETP